MPFDPALVTLAEARDICGVSGSQDDEYLRALIEGAGQVVDDLGRPKLKSRTYGSSGDEPAVIVSGRGCGSVGVPYWPVTAVSKVEYLSAEQPETWTEINLTTYPVSIDTELENRIFFRAYDLPWGHQNIRISMTAGYAPVPRKLSLAARAIILSGYKLKDKQLSGIASKSQDGQTVVYRDEDIPKLAKLYLREYANQEIGV